MSKKNKPGTAPKKPSEASKKDVPKNKKTAVIIAAAAIFLVVCILLGIFVVKPAVEKNKEPSTVPTSSGDGVKLGNYTYVDYNGTQMAEELAAVLNQAAIDSAAACEKYGVAVTLGDRDISRSEFHLYYLDQYRTQMTEVEYSKEKTGANRTGYDIDKLPDAQNHPTKDMTWAEEFTLKAIDVIKLNYAGFDMAIKTGVQLEENEIADVIMSYRRVENYANQFQKEPDEYVAGIYTDGLTYSMFAAREIIVAYASKYESAKKLELYDSYSEEKVSKYLSENDSDYKIIKARVYPIEGEYDPVEVSKVNTEKEFLEFANGNYPYGGYYAETRTQCFYVTKTSIANTFGDEVADWLFSSDRVPGETQVVEGQLFDYLCHVIELPYYGTSCHIMSYEVDHNEALDEEGKQAEVEKVEKMLEEWKNGDATPESFAEIAEMSSYTPERDVRSGEYGYKINNWLFDKARKPGDTAVFSDEYGIYMIYYVQKNEEDFDWNVYIRSEFAEEDYDSHFNEVSEGKIYEVDMNSSIVNRVVKTANVRITNQINERKNEGK